MPCYDMLRHATPCCTISCHTMPSYPTPPTHATRLKTMIPGKFKCGGIDITLDDAAELAKQAGAAIMEIYNR